MKETFERNLEASRSNEQNAAEVFASVKSAKQSEISAGTKMSETKETELTDANSNNAQAKEDLEDTRTALDADTTFLQNLKLKCQAADKEWEERKKVRQSEISAVSEAIEILANDDAKDLFSRTLGFLQVKSSAHRTRRSRASALLQKAASASGNPDMAALAMRMRLDSFAEVKRSIDKMVADLKRQQADEVDQKDWCNDELNTNEAQTSAKNDLKDDLNTKKEDLASAINTLNEAIAALKSDIADAQVAMKKASETRETENHEFQMTVSDQRATQTILTKAIDRLKQFYAKKLFLMQRDGQAPPEGFQKYKKSGGASGVIAMLEGIVADAKELEEKAIAAENDASQAYESFVQDTNNEIDAKANAITDKLEERAKLDATSTHASSDLKHTASDLGKLANYAGELHGSCDFLIKNFDERQTSRAEEIDALGQAKAIFSGADLR
jgi:chromosome segregation ATPase